MNLRSVPFVDGAVIGLTATLAALQTSPARDVTATKVQAKSVTLTGCVAQGIDADHYVLANAVRREDPPSSAAAAGTARGSALTKKGQAIARGRTIWRAGNSRLTWTQGRSHRDGCQWRQD